MGKARKSIFSLLRMILGFHLYLKISYWSRKVRYNAISTHHTHTLLRHDATADCYRLYEYSISQRLLVKARPILFVTHPTLCIEETALFVLLYSGDQPFLLKQGPADNAKLR